MSVVQVSVELVLAGILALCAFVLPFLGGQEFTFELLQNNALIGVLGIAYLIGVVFDKLADIILAPFENHLRIKQAAKYLEKKPKFKGKDPFPQNKLEFRLREAQDGRLQWMESLKSRIRTSRELAVLGLPATMGIVIHQGISKECSSTQTCTGQWLYYLVALNLILLIYAAWKDSGRPDEDSNLFNKKELKPDDLECDSKKRNAQIEQAKKQMRINARPYYLMIAVSIIGIIATGALKQGNPTIILIGIGGLIISLLSLWACMRITRTYLKFIAREMNSYLKEKSK